MKIQWFYLGAVFLLTTYVGCENAEDESTDGFSNFLSNLFNGWFENPSKSVNNTLTPVVPENSSSVNIHVSNITNTDGNISNIAVSDGNSTINIALPGTNGESQNIALSSPVGNVTPSNQSTASKENEQQTGFFASIFGSLEDKPNGNPHITTSTEKPNSGGICKANPDLTDFCQLSPLIVRYLGQNTTIEYLSQKIFNCDVVDQLQKKCARGEWCLSSKTVYDFMQLSDAFLGGSLCSPKLRACLKGISADQEGCPKSVEIYNMHVALDLLCKLGSEEGLTYECFGHAMAMLHVNFADSLRTDQVTDDSSSPDQCHLQKGLLIKHFICIRDLCTYQTDTIKSFAPWQWFISDVPSYEDSCKYNDVCGLENQVKSSTVPATTSTTTSTEPAVAEVNNAAVNGQESEPVFDEPTYQLKSPGAKTKVLIGISSAVLIATFGFTMLICALWKRVSRHNPKRYNPSYSKLANEESLPLYK